MNKNEIIRSLHLFRELKQERCQIVRLGIFGSVARGNRNYKGKL
jgi:predicted nucleotidyltransferase